jgi:hypothetical protein
MFLPAQQAAGALLPQHEQAQQVGTPGDTEAGLLVPVVHDSAQSSGSDAQPLRPRPERRVTFHEEATQGKQQCRPFTHRRVLGGGGLAPHGAELFGGRI